MVGIVNACQPPLQRDYAMPRIDIATPSWSSYGNGIRVNDNTASVFDYLDPQWQWVMNAGWNKGVHNVKFGVDVHRLHMNHYEITAPSFNFTGGATALNATGARRRTCSTATPTFCSGCRSRATPRCRIRCSTRSNGSNEQSATLRSWEYGIYIRDQFQLTRNLTVSAGVRWEYYPVPQHADRGVEIFDFTTQPAAAVRARRQSRSIAASRCRRISSRHASASRTGPTDSLVFRAGYSRNPQNDNMIGTRMRNFPVNVQINDVAVGGNNFTPVGSFSDGLPAAADSRPQPAACSRCRPA